MCEHKVTGQCGEGRKDCDYHEVMNYYEYRDQDGYEDSSVSEDEFYFKGES